MLFAKISSIDNELSIRFDRNILLNDGSNYDRFLDPFVDCFMDKNIKKIPKQWKDSKPQFEILGSFLVNLQNEEASVDRFAQIELVIEYFSKNNLDDFKTYQPIIHNEVLIYLSQKTASTSLGWIVFPS